MTTSLISAASTISSSGASSITAHTTGSALPEINPQRDVDLSARISHQLGQKNTVSLRYESLDQYRRKQGIGGVFFAGGGTNFIKREDGVTLHHTTTVNPQIIIEVWNLFFKLLQ